MKKLVLSLVASAVVLIGSSGVAKAAVGDMMNISIQGNTYSGTGELTNGNYLLWTQVSGTSETVPSYVAHAGAGGGYNFAGPFYYTADSSSAIKDIGGASSTMSGTSYAAMYDGYMSATDARTITLTGLDANKNYEMAVYAQRESGVTTYMKINDSQVLYDVDSNSNLITPGVNYALITTGLTSNGSGQLSFAYQGNLSGFQVKELGNPPVPSVPEPASAMLLGVGGIVGSFVLRRSREKAVA